MLKITKVSERLGAEVTGVDVSKLDGQQFAEIYQAFLDNIVLVIRDQHELSIEEYLGHSARFGRVNPHLVARQRHPQFPDLMLLDNQVGDQRAKQQSIPTDLLRASGTGWHTDLSYEDQPAKATQLYPIISPSSGGDTLFANAYHAHESLPDELRKRIEDLQGKYVYGGTRNSGSVAFLDDRDRDRKPAVHQVVKTHPETGRRSLYIDPRKFIGFIGMNASVR